MLIVIPDSWRKIRKTTANAYLESEFGLASTEGPTHQVHSLLSPLLLATHV